MNKSVEFWDKKAEGYAETPVSDEVAYQKKLLETQSFLSADMNILEFGCGTGTTAIHHAPYVKHIDAIDTSESMLAIGRERAGKESIKNIDFTRSTLNAFKADSSSLDAILGLNVIHLLPDRKEVLAEVARVLKPGGIFVSSTACLGNSYFRFIKLVTPLGKLMGLMPDVFVMTEDELVYEIEDAGFIIESRWHHGAQNIAVFLIARKR